MESATLERSEALQDQEISVVGCGGDGCACVHTPLPKTYEEMQEILNNYEAGEITVIQEVQ